MTAIVSVTGVLLGIAGLTIAAGLALYLASRPKAALVFWLFILCVAPFWLQIPGGISIPPSSIATLIVLPSVLKARPKDKVAGIDYVLILTAILAILAAAVRLSPQYAASALVVQWATAFFVARRLGYSLGRSFVTDVVAMAGMLVAVWAIVEFALKLHVYENVGTSLDLGFWAEIQIRGGLARSEAGFGHAIALGGFLAATVPFVMSSRYRFRLPMTAIVIGGTVATLSRGPMLSAIVAVVLAVAFLAKGISTAVRFWTVIAGSVIAIFALPPLLQKFGEISEELDPSTAYRENLWTDIPGDLNWIGQARNVGIDSAGRSLWRNLGSVDSTPLLIGLDFGWIIVGMFTACIVVACWRVLRRKGSVAEVAIVAQLPTLATVALITQYGAAVWFFAGLAVAYRHPEGDGDDEPEDQRSNAVKSSAIGPAILRDE
ncbi:hypothetical protein HQO24_17025 [Rhodococcus fascians]|nr:hypothetical protein [Rhodococcus fascians]MBY4398004.1 hypothetical protein [Rhodococcus fascians]MBY4409182.1 hypothetical protein [Rhodococcus fascians]MBY4422777.1 hypothetical protein [Rhodococcus fascians]MBY4462431.1 hypothetical protein [Rhodococcus fascians]